MAEPKKERDIERDRLEEYVEEEEKGALINSQLPNTSLAELNMLLVFLSLIYFSTDDCIEEYEDSEHVLRDEVVVAKTCISRLQTKRHESKLGRRSFSPRFQTTIRDSRYVSFHSLFSKYDKNLALK